MAFRDKQPQHEIIIDLTGPDGNAFALMAYAKRYGAELGYNYLDIIAEMADAGDYERLLKVFDNYFGEWIVLER